MEVQKAFDEAFKNELALQVDPMAVSLATMHSNTSLRNSALELLILHAKRCRAHAEMALYSVAVENCCGFDISGRNRSCSHLLIADAVAGPPTTLSELLLCKDPDMYCTNDEHDLKDGMDGSCGDFEDFNDYEH
jgi:hypothetical protein